ncbi:hypothetical protein, partial [Enterobacter roggenkampii]|uniref:hypothetical protein n=1 Tax=Enterobacter roggenkampii TaxID=1812935 RepID=UPI001C9D8DD0
PPAPCTRIRKRFPFDGIRNWPDAVITIGGASRRPASLSVSTKPTFLKMHNYQSNGMISHFNGMKNHAYWICTRINK